jgi:hypothetical protein
LSVRRPKWHERWRCISGDRRSCVVCMKRQNERLKRLERQRRLRGKLRRRERQRRLRGRLRRRLQRWRGKGRRGQRRQHQPLRYVGWPLKNRPC